MSKKWLFNGLIVGVLDVIPMILMNLSIYANLSAFTHWLIISFVVSKISLVKNSVLNAVIISFILLIPLAVLIVEKNFFDIIPVLIMHLVLGLVLGFLFSRN